MVLVRTSYALRCKKDKEVKMNKPLEIKSADEQLDEIYELIVGDDGRSRYTHEELKEYLEQILGLCEAF
jgi:hypothetical protein